MSSRLTRFRSVTMVRHHRGMPTIRLHLIHVQTFLHSGQGPIQMARSSMATAAKSSIVHDHEVDYFKLVLRDCEFIVASSTPSLVGYRSRMLDFPM
jgi:hypothetical protein